MSINFSMKTVQNAYQGQHICLLPCLTSLSLLLSAFPLYSVFVGDDDVVLFLKSVLLLTLCACLFGFLNWPFHLELS